MKRKLVLGGPGAGKTERLLGAMESALDRGVKPERIAFVGFTRAACDEARRRAQVKFGLSAKDLINFRTIHSTAFRALGIRKNDVVTDEHLVELSDLTGEQIEDDYALDGPAQSRLLTLDNYARATLTGLRRAWEDYGGEVDWFRLKRFSLAYAAFKQDHGLVDFTDMLTAYMGSGPMVDTDVAIVDEAQDLTRLQHAVIARAFQGTKELWFAGDDDQSIHVWAGADDDAMFAGDPEIEILPKSQRLPRDIFLLSRTILSRVVKRREKIMTDCGRKGSVEWFSRPDELDLGTGTWLLLARTRAQLSPFVDLTQRQGIPFMFGNKSSIDPQHIRAIRTYEALRAGKRVESDEAETALMFAGVVKQLPEDTTVTAAEMKFDASPIWHDALIRIPLQVREHYLAALRKGEKLDTTPRVRIDTIHASKGLEADGVVLITDLTHRTRRSFELNPDVEHKVFYVGVTRAKEKLCVIVPSMARGYDL